MSEPLTHAAAVLSMLHEQEQRNSATRRFRGEPVIAWTVARVQRSARIETVAVLCWDDQANAVAAAVGARDGVKIVARGARRAIGLLDAVTVARRWSDGWRGGVLQTCDFDQGWEGAAVADLVDELKAPAVVLVNPAAGLVDPAIIDAIVTRAEEKASEEMVFSPAAPGLGAVLIRASAVPKLRSAGLHPGKLLHYLPDAPVRDPIAGDGAAPTPIPVMRATTSFKLDSDRQIERIDRATVSLNGQLPTTAAEELVHRVAAGDGRGAFPREVRLELTATRGTSAIFRPGRYADVRRAAADAKMVSAVINELAAVDDVRLTLAGAGDPLEHPAFFEIVELSRARGIAAVAVETDLVCPAELARRVGESGVDLVVFHIPAAKTETYARVMGVDACLRVLENAKHLVAGRGSAAAPLLVPVFVKCRENLAEMEGWYDHWLRAVGTAVIEGPSDYAGLIPDVGVVDMAPPRRVGCRRLESRISVLCDGTIVACEQDVMGRMPLGRIGTETIRDAWDGRALALRSDHRNGDWGRHPLCGGCREWHRP